MVHSDKCGDRHLKPDRHCETDLDHGAGDSPRGGTGRWSKGISEFGAVLRQLSDQRSRRGPEGRACKGAEKWYRNQERPNNAADEATDDGPDRASAGRATSLRARGTSHEFDDLCNRREDDGDCKRDPAKGQFVASGPEVLDQIDHRREHDHQPCSRQTEGGERGEGRGDDREQDADEDGQRSEIPFPGEDEESGSIENGAILVARISPEPSNSRRYVITTLDWDHATVDCIKARREGGSESMVPDWITWAVPFGVSSVTSSGTTRESHHPR